MDSVASYSSQNHVDRIRAQNYSTASCQDEGDFGSIKTSLFRRSVESNKRPESVTSNSSSTRSRLRELVERKSGQDEHKTAANTVGDIQYFDNPAETLEFDKPRNSLDSKKIQEARPKKRKLSKGKEKEESNTKTKSEKYQSKLAEYYKLPLQLPQDEFYQHLTRSKAAEELLQKRFANSDSEFCNSYGRLCKHKEPEGSNLRRSRSLAVIREETFTDLQIQNHGKSKRSQLIPRARLFEKPCFKDRLIGRAKYQTKEEVLESIYIDSTASCFGDINAHRKSPEQKDCTTEKEDAVSRNDSQRSQSVSGSWPNLNEESKVTNKSQESLSNSRHPSEIDSLDSNYVRKHYNFEAHRQNYKDSSPETERSLVSPNPSKELYVTTDEHCSDNEDKNRSEINTPKSYTNDSLTRSEKDKNDEFPNVTKADTYDIFSAQSSQRNDTKILVVPEGTAGLHTVKSENDVQSIVSENDGTVSSLPDSVTSYISISIASSDKSHKLEYLANSLAEKIDEFCDLQFNENVSVASQAFNSETNNTNDPIYTTISKKKTFADIHRDSFLNKNKNLFNEILTKQNDEVYVSSTYIEGDTYSTKSHCTAKNITTEPFVTTLIENQYYSLPDINISKCLRKSERIDAQLREEDPDDIPCENTYEVAQTHFQEILSSKTTENYGQLNKSFKNPPTTKIQTSNCIYLPGFSEPPFIETFTKLEDDLKSIRTIESSNGDEKDLNYFRGENHQNEREINEIEGTIRNNKLITKSESLRINTNSDYKTDVNIIKSLSNDNINVSSQGKKKKTNIKKHYSLRQRDPSPEEAIRIPSPLTVEKSLNKQFTTELLKPSTEDLIKQSLLSRVQSFKTSAASNIALLPLSGHQTIVIDPPVKNDLNNNNKQSIPIDRAIQQNSLETLSHSIKELETNNEKHSENFDEIQHTGDDKFIETSSLRTSKDPFVTIKLNKVVKTTIPTFKKETCEKLAFVQQRFDKPPPKLIIKDTQKKEELLVNALNKEKRKEKQITMTRPQVLQVVDSRNKMQKVTNLNKIADTNATFSDIRMDTNPQYKDYKDSKNESDVKLSDAIKTDIEYQEKINSVKNYWSKLIDKSPELKEISEQDKVIEDHLNRTSATDSQTGREIEKENFISDLSVGSIIKSLESVKIVDSIRKISQTKLQLWKEETEKVKSDSEIEETPVEKIVKEFDANIYEKPKTTSNISETDSNRDTPEIEIVELSSDDNQNQKTQATLIKPKGFDKECDDFDHVRYKVMKSELFKNSMIANYRKEAQFDGLLQYLQDYSFQELLVNNNIVIIEPVRTKIEPAPRKATDTRKIPPTLLKRNEDNISQTDKAKNAIRRHFFYHPIRVNKEIIEEELPNPDTVKKVRNLFEDTLKMKTPMAHDPPLVDEIGLTRRATSYRNLCEDVQANNKNSGRKKVIRQLTIDTNYGGKKWDNASLSSGVSSGDLSSNNEYETDGHSPFPQKQLKDNVYSSSDEYLCDSMSQDFCCESQYVSPDILKKIRECGTSVTYYGGKVVNSKTSVSPMTKAIMDEIKSLQKNCNRDCFSCQTKCRGDTCSCLVANKHTQVVTEKQKSKSSLEDLCEERNKKADSFPGFKFKLVKSNSCSSRLELTGTDECKDPRLKYRKQLSKEDPPLVCDNENSVKNKICRIESYSRTTTNSGVDNKNNEVTKVILKKKQEFKPYDATNTKKNENNSSQDAPVIVNFSKKEESSERDTESVGSCKTSTSDTSLDPQSFEKKYYYVNENSDKNKEKTTKFGEMVFEEFEVLETCYDSLNSNKSLK